MIMNVYRVLTATDDYKYLDLDQRGKTHEDVVREGAARHCRGLPKPDWSSPPLRLGNPLKPEPDFWGCPVGGAFAVHPRVLAEVYPFFEMAGEMLPLKYKN